MPKPYDNQDCGGSTFNYPLAYDATTVPVTSPIAAAATVDLLVHPKAGRVNFTVNGAAGATVTVYKGATLQSGAITLLPNSTTQIDVGGMNSGMPDALTILRVVAGASSPVSFWFDSTTPTGA